MAIEPLQSAPYSVGTDAPDGPTQSLAVASWARTRINQVYATAAARTAAFAAAAISPAEGQQSYRTDDDVWEEWDGSAWVPLVEGGPWTAISLPAGWATIAGNPALAYRRVRRRVWWRGNINVPASQGTGTLWTMPVGFRPTAGQAQLSVPYSNGAAVTGSQRVNVGTSGAVAFGATGPGAIQQFMWTGLSYELD